MLFGLRFYSDTGVKNKNHGVGARGSGRHVPGVLLVTGRVRQMVAPGVRIKKAVRYINGDALLALAF